MILSYKNDCEKNKMIKKYQESLGDEIKDALDDYIETMDQEIKDI